MISRILILALCLAAFALSPGMTRPLYAGGQTPSATQRVQEEQRRRNAQIQAEARRRRAEYERQRREFKRQDERRRRSINARAGRPNLRR